MKNKILYISLFILFLAHFSFGQADTTVLSFKAFISRVKEHHPLAQQADLITKSSEADLMKARGNFDPKLRGSANQKYFNDQQYYSILNAGLKVPTWYGVSFQGGYDLNNGNFLNPERSNPTNGLAYAGVEVKLGRGLLIDKRRAELKKAKIYLNSAEQQRRILMNQLILEAAFSYWKWFRQYQKLKIYENAIQNAAARFDAVKNSALLGDRPYIDTVEANIQLQNRQFNYMESRLAYLNATAELEIYLWNKGSIPLELDSTTVPMSTDEIEMRMVPAELFLKLDSIKQNHPEVLNYGFKIDQKKVDIRLGLENLKPELNFKYNAINEPINGNPAENYSLNNYVWGAELNFPLFLRKERAELQLSRIAIDNLRYQMDFKTEQIEYKLSAAFNQWNTTFEQYNLWNKTTTNYNQLYQSEQILFNAGESSLFLVNSREKAYINAQLKLVDVIVKHQNAILKTQYAIGDLDGTY